MKYEVQHLPKGETAKRNVAADDFSAAAHLAVNLATNGSREVVIIRYQPGVGYDLVGMPRVYRSRLAASPVVLFHDMRTASQHDDDPPSPAVIPATPDGTGRRGRRSGMMFLGVGRRVTSGRATP